MKKLLSVILALCLLLTIMPLGIFNLTASAATEYTNGYYYTVSNGKAEITGCDDSISGDITIPSTLGGYPVISIGYYAFYLCNNLTSVTIPDSVTNIGTGAFESCSRLTDVTIPDSVTNIGESAFSWCASLTNITIHNNVTNIGDGAFCGTGHYENSENWENNVLYLGSHLIEANDTISGSYTIKPGTKTIADYAFYECESLTSIIIPDSVTCIGDGAFLWCSSLTNVYITDITAWCNIAFVGVTSNPLRYAENLFLNNELVSDIVIPDSVTKIGDYAFSWYNGLSGITIPDSVTSIGDYAFDHCYSLTNVTIGDKVTSIGEGAFEYCLELTSVSIPDGITRVREYTFCYCLSLTNIAIPDSLTSIGRYAFTNCRVEDVYYAGSEKKWNNISIDGYDDFFSDATIHYNSTGIPKTSGYYTYTISNGEATITDCDDSISGDITIPNTLGGYPVTSIGEFAFEYCLELTSITIPDSVISIGELAFSYCGFKKVTIGANIASIDFYAFSRCDDLTNIEVSQDNNAYKSIGGVLFDKTGKTLILCPGGKSGSYSIPDGVVSINDDAFFWCTDLTRITIPNSVIGIGERAFSYCGFEKITLGANVVSIGYAAFTECNNLKDVYYAGSKEDWVNISIGAYNEDLLNATIHYAKTTKKPSAPKTFTASLYGHDDVKLSWSAASGATKYRIYYKKASAKSYNYKTTTSSLTYSIPNLTDNCKYNFKVVPIAIYGTTTLTGTAKAITFSTTKDLEAPKTLKASLYGYDDAKLTWSAVSGASRYKIYYKQSSADTYKYKTYTTKTTYNFANLYDGVSYDFKIVPCSYVNGTHFEDNSYKTVTISSTINLTAPATLKAQLFGYDDVELTWSQVANADAYKVYYKKSSSKTYTLKTTTTALTQKIWNLSDGIKYDFKVVPCTYVNGGYFAGDSAKTTSIYTLKKLSAPTVTKHKAGKVKIAWTNIQGETGYEISRSLSKTGTYIVSDYKTTTAKAKIVSATKSKTYYYKIRVYKIVDGQKIYSPWSAVKSYKLK